ncbi:MAG: hypothetical protein GVY09_15995 [Gammaproteobacteria bacterium]|jgi:hypothetical protein|nr:hypothetical protein [Gammaproteobacteria bacterium]
MIAVLSALLCLLLVEAALRLPFGRALSRAVRTGDRARRVLASRHISEHWKEKAVGAYAGHLVGATLALVAMIAGLAAGFLGGARALEALQTGAFGLLLGWPGIVYCTSVASAWAILRRRAERAGL